MRLESETKPSLLKWLTPALLLLVAFLTVTACQTTSAASSSVIEDVAADTEAAVCADLRPEGVASEQYNQADKFWQDYLIRQAAAWKARCE